MSELKIQFEPENPEGARGPELRATWARLQILVDGEIVTRVEDQAAHSIRDGIYVPLYPIAEWIVTNWWNILNEVSSPQREITKGYWQRHNLAAASEGFALPNLFIRPGGKRTLLNWQRAQLPHHRLQFINEGKAVVETEELESILRQFINAVITRLDNEGVGGSSLVEEWKSIESADREEKSFCMAVGRLGLDPYELGESGVAQTVIRLSESLPSGIIDEFYAAADHANLKAQGSQLEDFFAEANELDLDLALMRALRDDVKGMFCMITDEPLPWNQGYEFARQLRKILKASPGARISTIKDLGVLFGTQPVLWERAISFRNGKWGFLNAAVGTTKNGSPYFGVPKRHATGTVFTLCRALFEYLTAKDPTAAIVTQTYSERQKRNRAFAAEFLAPAQEIRECIKTEIVTEEDIQDLAQYFGTSDFVVRHQILNHRLAGISEWI